MVPSAPAAIAPALAPFWPSIVKADLEKSPLRDMRARLLPPGPKKLAGNQRAPSEPTTRPVGDPYWNAARRLQAERLRKRDVPVLDRGVHERQTRHGLPRV